LRNRPAIADAPRALIAVAGPSGAGKTTIVRELLRCHAELRLPVCLTTRPRRPTERDGEVYRFCTRAEFDAVPREDFLARLDMNGERYGVLRAAVEECSDGGLPIVELSPDGIRMAIAAGWSVSTLLVTVGDLATLESRLRARGGDDADREARLAAACELRAELGDVVDQIVVNERLPTAVAEASAFAEKVLIESGRRAGRG
jgi:guanylate kinase